MSFPRQREVEPVLLIEIVRAGGEARPSELYARVAEHFPQLSPQDQEVRLESTPSTRKWANLVQWARQHLIDKGELDGSTRGIWRVTAKGRARIEQASANPRDAQVPTAATASQNDVTLRDLASVSTEDVRNRLLTELKALSPTGFEHFCKVLLQQLGYSSVEVTRRSSDGGIDGFGNFRQGAVSIKSAFQAKKWSENAVGRPDIDRLRGAIQGEYDHGVFLTTSRFSQDAQQASYKKGAI